MPPTARILSRTTCVATQEVVISSLAGRACGKSAALALNQQDQLPEEIREHVADCFECKAEIIETLELIWAIESPASELHPTFDYPRN